MSGRQNSDNVETLFSFEILAECVRFEKDSKVSDELALGVRLLDFPTLLIHQPQRSSDGSNQTEEHVFNRGKSCFFKMNANSLHTQLCSSPLYAMVLDVKEDIPKLVGTSLVSLANVVEKIRQDVAEHGASAPSSHGERGVAAVSNLKGERIGSISLSYKLLSLGTSLLPHITDNRGLRSNGAEHEEQECVTEGNKSAECRDSPTLDRSDVGRNFPNNNKEEDARRNSNSKELKETEEDDLTIFRPPHLFYSAKETRETEEGGYKLQNLDSFAFEDASSEDEVAESIIEGASSSVANRNVRRDVKMPKSQQTNKETPNALGEVLQQLPLLNALLVELSQLNDPNPPRSLSIHPNLSWIYRPASAEPSAGGEAQNKSLQNTRQGTPHLKHLHAPRNCSTPLERPSPAKKKDKRQDVAMESKSPRKKLVYGTTKTFNLRLKKNSPLRAKGRECMKLIQNEPQSSLAKGKTSRIIKSSKRRPPTNQGSRVAENIETMIQNITVDSARQETISAKQENLREKERRKQDPPRVPDAPLKVIHIPSVDAARDEEEHHSESDQSQSERDTQGDKIRPLGSSGRGSPKSSDSSAVEGNEEADYADDFNSLEASDAYSPDPLSSPEPSRAKTPRSPLRSDVCNSDSEGPQRRAVLPVPAKAASSPQRALRGTHIIRPRTHGSALSFSSDDGDRDASSLQTMCSRKPPTESRAERSSGTGTFISSRGQSRESTRNSGPVPGLSEESVSSFDPQEAEELEDDLGSLDFRKEYQHISKLVANKLPGYTM